MATNIDDIHNANFIPRVNKPTCLSYNDVSRTKKNVTMPRSNRFVRMTLMTAHNQPTRLTGNMYLPVLPCV